MPVLSPKERITKVLLGDRPDVSPAAPCYLSLYLADLTRAHYIEQYQEIMKGRSRSPVDHAQDTCFRAQALYQSYDIFKSPPDWIEVYQGASKSWAERTEIVQKDNILFYEDKASGFQVPMDAIPMPYGNADLRDANSSSKGSWSNSTTVASKNDVDRLFPCESPDQLLDQGDFDLPQQVVTEYGDRYFISTILDTPYSDSFDFLGFLGLMKIQHQQPDLFHYLLQKRLDQTRNIIDAWAATGIEGIFVEEVFTGADSISPQNYDRFVYDYNLPFFNHMRSSGLLPIHYICGDSIPRLKRVVDYDIIAIAVEESKKKFIINISDVVDRVGGQIAVFGNIDAVYFGLTASSQEMAAEVERQAGIGINAKGFVISTGSPFPLETRPEKIDMLVSTAHSFSLRSMMNENEISN